MDANDGFSPNNTQETEAADISGAPKIATLNIVSVVLAAVLVIAAFVLVGNLFKLTNDHGEAHDRYSDCNDASTDLMIASDRLTTDARMYVMTGDARYAQQYLDEFFTVKSREAAVNVLNKESNNQRATERLNAALLESNELATHELYAMKLVAVAMNMTPLPDALERIKISAEDEGLSDSDKRVKAQNLVLNDEYNSFKSRISQDVDDCASELVKGLEQNVIAIEVNIERLLAALGVIAVLLLSLVAFTAISNYVLVMRPMKVHARDMAEGKPLSVIGSKEIQNVSRSYNRLYYQTRKRTAVLKHEAETDPLTGLLNRGTYDKLMAESKADRALILIDVDKFKQVNDTYGHEVGDKVLKKVAKLIESHFRDSDYVCRIGGDEFAVILSRVTRDNHDAIADKLDQIAQGLAEAADDCPNVTLSFGVAFGSDVNEGESLYHIADKALYTSKKSGRNTKVFYGD